MNLKGFKFFILLFILISALIFEVYYVSFSKSEESLPKQQKVLDYPNWKTYSSTQYRFSFKYPPNLYIRPDSRDAFIGFLEIPNDNSSQSLIVSVISNPENIELQEFAEKNSPISNDRIKIKYENIKINDHPALIVRYEYPDEKDYNFFFVAVQGEGFIVTFSDEKGNEELVNQVVSTFTTS